MSRTMTFSVHNRLKCHERFRPDSSEQGAAESRPREKQEKFCKRWLIATEHEILIFLYFEMPSGKALPSVQVMKARNLHTTGWLCGSASAAHLKDYRSLAYSALACL
jgi:hypothetical protein